MILILLGQWFIVSFLKITMTHIFISSRSTNPGEEDRFSRSKHASPAPPRLTTSHETDAKVTKKKSVAGSIKSGSFRSRSSSLSSSSSSRSSSSSSRSPSRRYGDMFIVKNLIRVLKPSTESVDTIFQLGKFGLFLRYHIVLTWALDSRSKCLWSLYYDFTCYVKRITFLV